MATFNITNTDDSGAGSLRDAIIQANTVDGDDTIDLSSVSGTITLGSLLPKISSNITFVGNGDDTIAGDNLYRVFWVDSGTVNFSNLTIANGLAKGGNGAAIGGGGAAGLGGALFINDATVSVDRVSFNGNQALGGDGGSGYGSSEGSGGSDGYSTSGTVGSSVGLGYGGAGGDGGFGGGGGAGGSGDSSSPYYPGNPIFGGGGKGGNGGFGGGGGAGGWSGGFGYPGAGGNGGFGGGGGAGGSGRFRYGGSGASGGAGGNFAGAGGSSPYGAGGGGGAGLGGAIFIRAGSLTLNNSSFQNNSAAGGAGGSGTSNGTGAQGKGGAIFVNDGATVTVELLPTFSGNSAINALSTATDNADVYGILNVLPNTPTLLVDNTDITQDTSVTIPVALDFADLLLSENDIVVKGTSPLMDSLGSFQDPSLSSYAGVLSEVNTTTLTPNQFIFV